MLMKTSRQKKRHRKNVRSVLRHKSTDEMRVMPICYMFATREETE